VQQVLRRIAPCPLWDDAIRKDLGERFSLRHLKAEPLRECLGKIAAFTTPVKPCEEKSPCRFASVGTCTWPVGIP
jgi:hypothetical protein